MKRLLLLASLFLVTNSIHGQILTFDFAGLGGSEATANSNSNDAGLSSSTISRGAGLTASANGDRFNATSWATGSIANAISGNDYMEFTITPTAGNQFSVSSIVFQIQRSGTGLTAIALRNSLDGYAANLDGEKAITDNANISQTVTFTFTQTNSSTAVTYRLYGYAEATGGTGGPEGAGNDIVVNGSVSSTGPSISVSPASTNFGTSAVNTPTAATTYSISGSNLTGAPGNITITPPNSDFQVSIDNISFGNTIDIAFSSATLNSTDFYVRFNPQSAGAKSGNLGFSGGGLSTSPTISVSGTGLAGSELSDVVVASGFNEPENIAYASNQATDATDVNSVEVARFTLRDGGSGLNDADALATTLTAISFSVSNHTLLRRIALYDGTTELGEVAAAATVDFSSLSVVASDNASKDFSIRVTFAATVTDRQQFSFTVSSVTANGTGSLFAAANGGAAASSTTGDRNKIQVTATALAFVQQPSNVGTGNNMTPAVTISANDALGNRDTDFTGNVQIISTGTLTGSPVIVAAASGLATFSTLSHSATGTGLTLTAQRNPNNDWDITSNTFSVAIVPAVGEIVINQMSPEYASASEEYVEIVNLTNKTFDLSFVKLVYQSSSGNNGSAGGTLSGMLQPYSFWLLSPNATVNVGQTASLARDGSFTAGFAGSAGQIGLQLVSDNTTLDAVGYGTLTGGFREGTAASSPPADGGIKRTIDGNDTNDNSADFSTVTNANIKLRNSNSRIAIAGANLPTGTYSNVVVTGNHILDAAINVNNQLELVNGTLTTGGNLTLKSSSTRTAQVVGGTNTSVTGNVTVERFLPWQSANNDGYRFVGHPMRNNPVLNTVGNLPTANNTVIVYNEAANNGNGAYVGVNDRTVVWPQGTAYGIWTNAENTISFTGELQLSDVDPIVLSNSGSGWLYIANPFPSVVDFNAVTRNNVNNAKYRWIKDNTGQGNGNWGSYAGGIGSNGGSRQIAPGQGFMVKTTGAGQASIAFPASSRINSDTVTFARTGNLGDVYRVKIEKISNQSSMETVVRFTNQATGQFDSDFDAYFLSDFSNTSPDLYSTDAQGTKYSIQSLPVLGNQTVIIPLGLETFGAGAFSFQFDASGMVNPADVRLEDQREGTFTQVIPGQNITISSGSQDNPNRFRLHFNSMLSTSVQPHASLALSVYTFEGNLFVNGITRGELRITDLSGRTVYHQKQQTFGEAIRPGLAKGAYLVQVNTSEGSKFVKVIF